MKRPKILAAALAVILALTACGSNSGSNGSGGSGDTDLKTVDVGHVQLSIFAPLYVADAKGYFEDEGIKINLENIKSGQDGVPLASSGKLDLLVAGFSAGMFSSIQKGLDVKVVGSMGVQPSSSQPSPSALLVSQKDVDDGKYSALKDLDGMTVAAAGGDGGTGAYYISMALQKAGLSMDDIDLKNLSNPDIPSALKSGSVDAGFPSAPFWQRAVKDKDAKKVWTMPKGTSGTGIVYGGDFAESELAQPFFKALAHGAQDLQGKKKHANKNLKIIGKATDQSAKAVDSSPLYNWYPDLHPLPKQLASMEQSWMKSGAITYDKPIPKKKYVDESFAQKVKSADE